MQTYGVVLLHEDSCSHSAAHTWALLEYFNWELFDHPPYSSDLTPSDYHLFTYLKNWLGSQHFNNNEELIEGVKTWLSSWVADFWHRHTKTFFPIRQVFQFRRWLCCEVAWVCIYVSYIIQIFFSLLVLLTPHWKLLSEYSSYLPLSRNQKVGWEKNGYMDFARETKLLFTQLRSTIYKGYRV
jgi:transposase